MHTTYNFVFQLTFRHIHTQITNFLFIIIVFLFASVVNMHTECFGAAPMITPFIPYNHADEISTYKWG